MPSSYQHILNEDLTFTTLQNVPFSEHTQYFDSIVGMNAIIPNEVKFEENHFWLTIIEQPSDTFRYRYKSEKGSHGGIKGESSSRGKKSFPTVKLENCPPYDREKIIIRVSLYRNDGEEKLHVYELTGKNCSNGICETTLDDNFQAVFSTIAISTRKKEEVFDILKQRKISELDSAGILYSETSLETEVQEEIKSINLDSARLCFEAFSTDDRETLLCNRVFSNPINNQKSAASGDLKIVRLSRPSGKCSGGDEIWLACEKVKKEDIKVRFFDKEGWEDYGDFNPAEVHHQVVIIVKTPKYHQTNVHKRVYIELFRPSDKKNSDPRPFDFIPDDDCIKISKLNKKLTDTEVTNLLKTEFFETSRKRKRSKLEEYVQNSDDYLKDSSVADSPQSIDDQITPSKDFNFCIDMDYTDLDLFSDLLNEHSDNLLELFEPQSESTPTIYPYNALTVETNMKPVSNFVTLDCVGDNQGDILNADVMSQCLSSMNSLSLADQPSGQESQTSKVTKASKDFIDGMNTILQNREANTYLHYASHLIPLEDENGNSMLHLAILEQNGNWNLIKNMVKMVSEDLINHQNNFGETPLHLAIKKGHVKILLCLLLKGADPNICDRGGNNCLHLAAKYGRINCLKILIRPIHRKICKHKMNDIDNLNYDGMSALHIAVTRNFEDCVAFLLNFKANVNLPEKKCGRTSLHLAIEYPSLLQIILKQPKVDIYAEDFAGYTAVHLACLKTGKSLEAASEILNDDQDKIIEFLENIHENKEVESDGSSTNSSDFEDAVEVINSACNEEKVLKTASTTELVYMNEKKSNLMEIEEKLHKYLDMNDNWKKLAELIDLNVEYISMFDKEPSPGQIVLKKIKDLYHPCDSKAIIEILKIAELHEGIEILQKSS